VAHRTICRIYYACYHARMLLESRETQRYTTLCGFSDEGLDAAHGDLQQLRMSQFDALGECHVPHDW
jgi:hypothetical protein